MDWGTKGVNAQCYYTLASYYETILDQMNNYLLAILFYSGIVRAMKAVDVIAIFIREESKQQGYLPVILSM